MGDTQSSESLLEEVRDLPPSAKLVFKILEYEGPLTSSQLTEETRLSSRTVRHATNQLEEKDVVNSQSSFRDARQSVYSLADSPQEHDANEESF